MFYPNIPSPVFVRNPQLLSKLPTPLVSLASYQLAGRGRGSNVWLSPSGSLLFSILLRVSLSDFAASKLVFIQYLFSLAVAEACREESVLGSKAGGRVRLKWPNDIYAVESDSDEVNTDNVKKIGGVLVSASFTGGNVDIVIGTVLFIQRDLKCDSSSIRMRFKCVEPPTHDFPCSTPGRGTDQYSKHRTHSGLGHIQIRIDVGNFHAWGSII
jgi:Biotin/lipoate A/B protein ligase family